MSALADAVKVRVPEQRLKELTNIRNRTASTIDDVVLEAAVDDATADFKTYAQERFDIDETQHVAVGIRGVIAYLKSYAGQEESGNSLKDYQFRLKDLTTTRARSRLEPGTNSFLDPTDDPTNAYGSSTPDFDRRHFRDIIPQPGGGGRSDDDPVWTDKE